MDQVTWQNAQAGQLAHHQRWSEEVGADVHRHNTREEFETLGIGPYDFQGKTILDFGAGSRLRSLYFQDARIIALEPLALKYINTVRDCDIFKADEIITTPGETLVEPLRECADLILCRDMLDQCRDPVAILNNLAAYLKPDGLILLSFDVRTQADVCHPHVLDDHAIEMQCEQVGLVPALKAFQPPHGSSIKRRVVYWLRKVKPYA